MDIIFELINILVCLLEVYLMFDFFAAFFPIRERLQKGRIKVMLVLVTTGCVRGINFLGSSGINLAAMQVIYISLLMLAFYGSFFRKMFYYLVATVLMISSEFLWIVLMSVPSGFSLQEKPPALDSTIFTLLCVKFITFILFQIVKRISKTSNYQMDRKNFLLYSVVPLATLGIMIALAYLDIDFDSVKFVHLLLLGSSTLVIAGNILIFYVFDKYTASMERLRQQQLVITKLEMEEKRYEQIESVNREHAGFLHDIRHYMKVIGELATGNKNGEIAALVSELQVKVSEAETVMLCRNPILNAVLNEKKREAEEKHIDFQLRIEPDFMVERIKNTDLIVITGNLLDNALEAASKCEEGFIKVYMFSQNENYFSVIKIVNNYTGEIREKAHRLITGKADKSLHGFGIQNVNDTARKYGGYLETIYGDKKFTAIVLLPNEVYE